MTSTLTMQWLQRRGIHYGWLVAGITFLTMFVMAAALGLPGAMLTPLTKEFGWSIDEISSSLAVRFVLFGLMGPLAAVVIERWGLKRVMALSLLCVASSMLLVVYVREQWQLFVLWGILLGVGTGMTALVLGAVVANRWFVGRRGLVIGVLTASSATGQLAFMPAAAWMIEHFGWRSAVIPVAVACAVVFVLVMLFIRSHPSELNLPAYGTHAVTPPAQSTTTWKTPFVVLAEASRSSTFWILASTFFVCGLSTNGLVQTHFITLCGDFGLAAVPAASVLALMGLFDFFGTIASGWLTDRYDSRKLLFWYYGLRGLSLFWLPNSGFTLFGLTLFGVFYGLNWVATVPPTVKLASATFGPQKVGLVFGWIFAAHQLGAAVAAWGAGLSRAILLSYTPALYASATACIVGALLVLLGSRKMKQPAAASA